MDSLTEEKDDICYFYMIALEMDIDITKRDETDREIIIPENVQMNEVLSKQIPGVKYLFQYVSDAGSILIDINLEDEAPLDVIIYYENSEITDK